MRLVFFGSGPFGLPTLKRLAESHDVALVVSQPDRPAGRTRQLTPTPIRVWATDAGLPTLPAEDANRTETIAAIQAADAAAYVVIAFGQKLGADLLAGPTAMNLHASLLPRFRGAAPINWAILSGERETGITVIRMSQRIDTGDILAQQTLPVDPMETAGELTERLAALGPDLVMDTLASLETGTLAGRPQDERLASRAPKLSKSAGTVRFDQPAADVQRRVHGLTPWPGCRVRLAAHELRLARVETLPRDETPNAVPGELIDDDAVACASGAVRLLEVQPPGGKVMPFTAWRRGHKLAPDARMEPL